MEARQIYKSGAVVLIVAVALVSAYELLRVIALNGGDPTTSAGNALFVPTFVVSLIGTTFFVMSLPITYARQALLAGKTGLVGLGCYIASGLIFGYAIAAINAIIVPFLYGDPSTRAILTSGHPAGFVPLVTIGTLLFTIGNLCYGIGTLRAGVYPRALAFSLMVAAALEVAGFVASAANINLPGWTDLITDAASFGPIAGMAVWLLRESRLPSAVGALPAQFGTAPSSLSPAVADPSRR
jgi:hypothetical protein